MNTRSLLASVLLLAASLAAPLSAADRTPANVDRATQLLATQGSIPVQAAGRYVQPGSFRIHVSAHLGRPDLRLPDGTWIYQNRQVNDSGATGALVVRFNPEGRVSSLSLATPTVVAALRQAPARGSDSDRVAQR